MDLLEEEFMMQNAETISDNNNWSSVLETNLLDTFNSTSQNLTKPFNIPIEMIFNSGHRLQIAVYSILFLFSSIGNLTVLVALIRRRRKTPSRIDLMLMNLAIADLMVTFLMMPLEVVWAVTVSWHAGDFMCRFMAFFRIFGLYLSSYILVCISIDRYLAVLKPLNSYGVDKRGKIMIAIAWISSCVCSAPQSVIFHVQNHPQITKYRQCVTFNFFAEEHHIVIYTFLCTLFMYIIPLVIIIFCYASIYIEIFQKSQMTNGDRLRRSSIQVLGRAKRRTLRMTITIIIAFVVCWTPYNVIVTWFMIDPKTANSFDQRIQKGCFLFACTNSCLNPIVYGFYNIRRKSSIKNISLMHSSAKRSQEFIKSDSRRTMISEFKEPY